jgi:uncharacterized membrane protein YkoI
MIERGLYGLVAAVLLAVALLAAGSASARPRPEVAQADAAVEHLAPAQRDQLFPTQQGGVSLAQATAMARSRFPGQVVRAQEVREGDRVIYEIRILGEDGRTVRNFRIDAQTGSFL